jgi:5-deoxy-glucuronate isomerase
MIYKVASDYHAKVYFEGIGEVERRLQVTPEIAGWDYLYFRSYTYRTGLHIHGESAGEEMVMVLLSGSVTMEVGGQRWVMDGRKTVFDGRPYTIYLPPGCEYSMTVHSDADCAYSRASAEGRLKPRMIPPEALKVETVDSENGSRQVTHILDPGDAEKLMCVETHFRGGAWADYPAHRHLSTDGAQVNAVQYYRFQPDNGWALQRLYTANGEMDEAVVVHNGDAVIIRDCFHPVVACPGVQAYFLNFLATPNPIWNMQIDLASPVSR